jgi:serine/threonine protein kinase HipA of HipAB toxin-antitoxin module
MTSSVISGGAATLVTWATLYPIPAQSTRSGARSQYCRARPTRSSLRALLACARHRRRVHRAAQLPPARQKPLSAAPASVAILQTGARCRQRNRSFVTRRRRSRAEQRPKGVNAMSKTNETEEKGQHGSAKGGSSLAQLRISKRPRASLAELVQANVENCPELAWRGFFNTNAATGAHWCRRCCWCASTTAFRLKVTPCVRPPKNAFLPSIGL